MRLLSALVFSTFVLSCSPKFGTVLVEKLQQSESTLQHHSGFYLYDLQERKTVVGYHADRYFTPASNVKLLTLATCLTLLEDSVPALRYSYRGDSLIFWGTGDPSFLYRHVYNNVRTLEFLRSVPGQLFFSSSNFYSSRFGAGWSWDDYTGAYQPERSPFPIYGNVLTATLNESKELWIEPSRLAHHVVAKPAGTKVILDRAERSNAFSFQPTFRSVTGDWDIPFITSDSLTVQLLCDTLGRVVQATSMRMDSSVRTLYATPADSLYKILMQDSDNFLAEQLLMVCSSVVSDSLSSEPAIRFAQQNILALLPDRTTWVDGSGLSRYNLITPRSVGELWRLVYERVPKDRLFPLLATGGVNGTVKNWYKGSPSPYIFGKTGTLSNNHNLSGFLITASGKTLIFAFMNNNFLSSTSDVRRRMQEILEYIRDNYK